MHTLPPQPRNPKWKALAPPPPEGTTTFAAQKSLPRLPVPALPDTLKALKESLRPLTESKEELEEATRKIDDFAGSEVAQELQARLGKRAAETEHWLEEWWDDVGYLGYRDSVVINVSYYYGFDAHPSHLPQTPASRAASIARAGMLFRRDYKRGLIKPEATKEGPICMDTYRYMFDCSRVPGAQGLDWYVSYAEAGDTGDSGHIVVFRKNRVWKLDMFAGGQMLSLPELEKQIQHIYDSSTGTYPGVGVLTASNRDVWAIDYTHLSSDPTNASILREIHSAAFVIALDDATPSTPIEHSRGLWHGGLANRWVDKPCQFVVFDNALAGFMGEHAVMDGTPTVRLCDDVLDAIADPAFASAPGSAASSPPVPLDWNISPATEAAIEKATAAADALTSAQELNFLTTPYGKAAIKSFGVSPDSWAQMIVQLARKRLGGRRAGGTYEAASTRRFYKGRTEAIRVVSAASDAWVRAMDDTSAGAAERKALFDEATRVHVALAKRAGAGLGVDRHLFGLKKCLRDGEPLPAFFTDALVQRSSYWELSTSAVFSKHFDVYGWGEVVPDGFGVAYMTGFDDRLVYTITSRTEMPNKRFCEEIELAAKDLYDLHAGLKESAATTKPRL